MTDPSLIGLMREEFASVFDHAKPFLSSFSQKELPQFQARSIPAEEVIFIQKHPGACLMVTDDLVDKYVPNEFKETLKQHFHFMQQMNASEGITLDGIREFARNHVISESGFYVEANTSDIINALEQLKARLDRNLFVLDTEKFRYRITGHFFYIRISTPCLFQIKNWILLSVYLIQILFML